MAYSLESISVINTTTGAKQKYSLSKYTSDSKVQNGGNDDDDLYSMERNLRNQIYDSKQIGGNDDDSNSESDVQNGGGFESEAGNEAIMNLYLSSKFENYYSSGGYAQIGGRGEGLAIHREFIKHIQDTLKVKGGIPLQKLGSLYKKLAKEQMPNETNTEKMTAGAKKIFDNDKDAKKKYDAIVQEWQKNKKTKKSGAAE
jgi:hypothetical protein